MSPGRLPPLPTISEIVRLYKLRANKQLSQNFLLDMNLCRKLVRSAGRLQGCHVTEVGPGPGGITRALLERGVANLSLIELDKRFIPGLQVLADCSDNRLSVHQGDVLGFDFNNFYPAELAVPWTSSLPSMHLIGNLPFNVSTPLIVKWLRAIAEQTGPWSYGRIPLTLTFQKEVAERMVAGVGDKQRSRLSIMCQYLCSVKLQFSIPGSAFVPPPKVDVGVVRMVPLKEPQISLPFDVVERVVRYAFQYRNKRCWRGIEPLFPPERSDLVDKMFRVSSVSPDILPTQLTMDDFSGLCQAYSHICEANQGIRDYNFRSRQNARAWRRRKKLSSPKDSETDDDNQHLSLQL